MHRNTWCFSTAAIRAGRVLSASAERLSAGGRLLAARQPTAIRIGGRVQGAAHIEIQKVVHSRAAAGARRSARR
eukprot:6194818-Pleurochrysis_carterae.AAC.5